MINKVIRLFMVIAKWKDTEGSVSRGNSKGWTEMMLMPPPGLVNKMFAPNSTTLSLFSHIQTYAVCLVKVSVVVRIEESLDQGFLI